MLSSNAKITIVANKRARKYINRLRKAAKKLPAKSKRSKWHRVEDELPSLNSTVEIRSKGYFDTQGHWQIAAENISRWRELPKFKEPK